MSPANDNGPAVECITIDGGIVTKSTTTGARGVIVHNEEIGKYRFFVSHIDADGYEHPIWDGGDYDKAIAVAERMRSVVGSATPIRDIVGGVGR